MACTIFAHRGASGNAPENTMIAFQLAHEYGAEGIETDVQLTKDNIPVLIHDERLNRTTKTPGLIKDMTYSQIKDLNANFNFMHKYGKTPIPTLEEFLQWVKDKPLRLNLELKNNKIAYKHLEEIVLEILAAYQLADRTIISTFNPVSVKKLKSCNTRAEVAYLTSKRFFNPLSAAIDLGADAVHVKTSLLRPKLLKACQKKHIKLRVYTPNKMRQMLACMTLGCDGLITDFPKKAIDCRHNLKI